MSDRLLQHSPNRPSLYARRAITTLLGLGMLASCSSAGEATEPDGIVVIEAQGYVNASGDTLRCVYNLTREGVLDNAVQSEVLDCDFEGESLGGVAVSGDTDVDFSSISMSGIKNAKGTELECLRVYSESGIFDQSVRSEGISCDFEGHMATG